MTYKQKVFSQNPPQQAQKIWKNYLLSISQSKDGFIHRYGLQQGIKRYQSFKEKSLQTQSSFIKRWGQEQGKRRWDTCIKKRNAKNPRRLQYWLEICQGDYQNAKNKLSQYQSHSKDWFLKRYGNLDRYNSWSKKQKSSIEKSYNQNPQISENISKTLKSINSKLTPQQRKQLYSVKRKWIKKYGQTQGTHRFLNIYINRNHRNHRATKYSLMGMEFCERIIRQLNSEISFDSIRYGKNEKFLLNEELDKLYFYDLYFRLNDKQLIIEFNGDFWHANPCIYMQNYLHPVCKRTAKQIWDIDAKKISLANHNGIEVIVVWERDYKNDKQRTIQNLIKEIKEVFNGRIN